MPDLHVLPVSSAQLIDSLGDEVASLIHADPAWTYRNSGARGVAANKYQQSTELMICRDLMTAHRVARPDAYMYVWCTYPKIWEFLFRWALAHLVHADLDWLEIACAGDSIEPFIEKSFRLIEKDPGFWRYLSGGAWAKTNQFGVGFHWRGDSELQLLFGKGKPKPRNRSTSNLTMCKSPGHSIKPYEALEKLVRLTTDEGDLVVDLYAGESGSMGKVCKRLGRRYVGAEIDADKAALANEAIEKQAVMFSE